MKPDLCITIRFIHPFPLFHGRRDAEQPEWPPAPMRAFQALLNAASLRVRGREFAPEVRQALQTLEVLKPYIIAPRATLSTVGYRAYVPHNHADLVTAAWHRGNLDANIASHRMEKDFRSLRIETIGDDLPTVRYLYPLEGTTIDPDAMLRAIRPSVRSITHLGWGIDMAVGDAAVVDAEHAAQLDGVRWKPSSAGGTPLRVPKAGTLDDLARKHADFLNRVTEDGYRPVPPLRMFDVVRYRRDMDPLPRPHVVFKLLDDDDDTVAYPHAKLIHVAGMVRHAAIKLMAKNPPRDLRGDSPEKWLEQYVAGHRQQADGSDFRPHAQFSYVPLPSTGHVHADPAVRRVMIVAPLGDESWLEHLALRLDGVPLEPLPGTTLPRGTRLERIPKERRDGVRDAYTGESQSWASFTPVILPGHDDHKPEKTRKLILKALAQSGVEQPCMFEWSAFSRFPKSYSAHKYDRDKRPVGYIRPDHLLRQTAVHLKLQFEHRVAGPITIGAGRHCGFGVFVRDV